MNIDKIKRDPYYNKLFNETNDYSSLVSSGYFEDNLDYIDHTLNLITTPFNKLKESCNNKENIVLLTTGGFNPIHNGHINMMNLAKQELEHRGYNVLGGYISPCHYNYANKKIYNNINNSDRIRFIQEELLKSDWLMLEPWESLYLTDTVNFTEVITRLELYLNKYVNKDIKVIYVYGSDNISFANCLSLTRTSVCVSRNSQTMKSNKCIFISNNTKYSYLNSTNIRKNITEDYFIESNNFIIRTNDVFIDNDNEYINNLIDIFNKSLINKSNIKTISAINQETIANLELSNKQTISLDSCFSGTYNIEFSRLFDISSDQVKPKQYINRPGSLNIKDQISLIKPGNYILVDDDSVSGKTIDMIIKLMPYNVIIEKIYLMSNQNSYTYYDVVDSRDFLFNKENAGLVVSIDNDNVRVPYIYPFVSLNTRASVRYTDMAKFSINILEENIRLLDNLTISELIKDNTILFYKLGYKDSNKIKDILKDFIYYLNIVDGNLNL